MERIGDSLKRLVGNNIKRLRIEAGYRQGQFAQMLGITSTTLSKIENGETDIKLRIVSKASVILGKPIQDFIFAEKTLVLSKEKLKTLIV